jgi:hypothetical protein
MERAMKIILLGLCVWFTLAVLVVFAHHKAIGWVRRRAQQKDHYA